MARGRGAAHDLRRSELIAATVTVASEDGVGAVSLTTVATRAGVSPGRVQYYFPTMDELLYAAFEKVNLQSSQRIAEVLGCSPHSAPPHRALAVVLTQLIPHDEVTRAHMHFRQSFTALALRHDGIAELLRERYRYLHHEDLGELIRRGMRAGSVSADIDPVAIAIRLAALAEGLAYYVLIDATSSGDAQEQLLAAVDDVFTRCDSDDRCKSGRR
jgi:AcrR family transcriptional regulator